MTPAELATLRGQMAGLRAAAQAAAIAVDALFTRFATAAAAVIGQVDQTCAAAALPAIARPAARVSKSARHDGTRPAASHAGPEPVAPSIRNQGRPSTWPTEMRDEGARLAALGMTDARIAAALASTRSHPVTVKAVSNARMRYGWPGVRQAQASIAAGMASKLARSAIQMGASPKSTPCVEILPPPVEMARPMQLPVMPPPPAPPPPPPPGMVPAPVLRPADPPRALVVVGGVVEASYADCEAEARRWGLDFRGDLYDFNRAREKAGKPPYLLVQPLAAPAPGIGARA